MTDEWKSMTILDAIQHFAEQLKMLEKRVEKLEKYADRRVVHYQIDPCGEPGPRSKTPNPDLYEPLPPPDTSP